MNDNWKNLISSVAPTIATLVGGPMAGMATKALSSALLGHEDGTQADIQAAIKDATPDDLLKLRNADNELKKTLTQAGVDLEKIAAGDREGARDMAKKTSLVPQAVLSTIYVLSFAGILYAVFSHTTTFEDSQKTVMVSLIGILSAGLMQIMNFWFGSSAGSKQKTDLIGKQ